MPGRTVVQDMPIADSQGLLDEEGGTPGAPKKTPQPVFDLDSAYYSLPKGELVVAYDRALAEKKRVVVSMSTFARMYPKKTAARAEAFMKKGGEIVGKPGVSVDDLAGGQAEQYLKSGLPVTFNLDNLIHGDPAQTLAQWQPAFRSMMDQGFTPRVSRQTLARLYPNDPNRENRARLGGWELYDAAPARDVIGRIPRQEPAEMAYFALDEVKAKKDGSGRFRVYVSSGRAKDQEKQLSAVFGGAPRSIYSVPVSQLPQDLQVEYQASSDGSVVMEGAVADLPKSFKPWQQGLKRFFAVDGKARAHPPDLASGEYIYNVLKDPNKNLWQKGWTALMGYTLGQAGKMAEEVGGRMQQTAEIATMGLNTQVNPKAQKAPGRFSIGALNVLGESISGIGRAAVELSTPESGQGIGAYIGNVATFGVPSVYSMSKSVNHRIARGVDPYDAVIRSVEDIYGPMVKAGNKAAAIVYAKPAMIFGLAEALYSGTMAAVTGQEKPGEAVGPGASKVDEFKARPVSTAFSMFGIPANGLRAMGFSDEFAQEAEGILMLTAMDGVMRAASARAQYKAEQPGRIAKLSAENTRLISDLINQRREAIQASGEPLPPWLDPQLTTVEAVRSAQQSIGEARDAAKADMADHFLRTAIGDEFMRDVQAPTADQLRMLAELQRRQTATGPEADYYKKTKVSASEEAAKRQSDEEVIAKAQKIAADNPGLVAKLFGSDKALSIIDRSDAIEILNLAPEEMRKSALTSAEEFKIQPAYRDASESARIFQKAGEKLPGEIAAERSETREMWRKKGEASRMVRQKSSQESGRMLTKEPQRRASQSAEVFASENVGKITPRQLVEDVRAGRITIQDAAKQLRGLLETGERWRREQNATEIRGDQTVHAEEVPGRERGGGGGTRIEGLRGNPEAGGAAHPDRGGEGAPAEAVGASEAIPPESAAVQPKKTNLTTSQVRELEGLIADGRGKRLTKGGGFVRDSKGNIVKRIGAQSGYGELFRYLFRRGEKKGNVQEPGGPLSNQNKYRIFEVFEKAIRGEKLTAKQQGYVDTALNAARTLNEDAYRQSMVSKQHSPDAAEAAPFYEPLLENDYEVISLRNLQVGDTYTHAGEKFTVTAREGDVVEVQDGTTLRLDPEHETILIDKGSLKANINEPGAFDEVSTEPPPEPSSAEIPAEPESMTIRGQEFKYADMPDVYKRMPEAELQRGVKNGEAWPQLELQHRGLGAEKQPISEAMREKADALEAKAAEYRKKTGGANANPFADPNMWGSATYQLAADLIRGAAHVVDFATWSAHAVKQFGEQAQDRLKQMWEEAQRLAEATGWKRPEEPAAPAAATKPSPSTQTKAAETEKPKGPEIIMNPFRPGITVDSSQIPARVTPLKAPKMPEQTLRMGNLAKGTSAGAMEWTRQTLEKSVHGYKEIKGKLSPTSEVTPKQLDIAYRMKAKLAEAEAEISFALEDMEKYFDAAGKQATLDFIDRRKQGIGQTDPNLQAFDDYQQMLSDQLWQARKKTHEKLGHEDPAYKEHHERVIWKVLPAKEGEANVKKGFGGRRRLAGSRGYEKQSTLETMTEGIERGGEPIDWNPVRMLKIDMEDQLRFPVAHDMLDAYILNGDAVKAKSAPEGFRPVNDPLFQVHPKAAERYYAREGVARLLENFVSRDAIRESVIGRTALDLKNSYTQLELAINGFHATFESLEAVCSQIGRGSRLLLNVPGMDAKIEGLRDLSTAIIAPIEAAKIGNMVYRSFKEPDFWTGKDGRWLEQNIPGIRKIMPELFVSGAQLKMPNDFRTNYRRAAREAFEQGNLSAIPKGVLALNEWIMAPLFDKYIPRLKLGVFMKEASVSLRESAKRIEAGHISQDTVLRNNWRFVEDRFGELNYDNQFWDRTFKTAMQLMFRSVTWKLGNLRGILGALPEQGREIRSAIAEGRRPMVTQKMAWLAGMSLGTAVIGSLTMKAFTGRWPEELKDFVFPQVDPNDPNVRLNTPTYWKDVVHLFHDPVGYFKSSLSGDMMRMADIWDNKDYFSNMIYDPDDPLLESAWNVMKHIVPVPISVSSAIQMSERNEPYHLRLLSFLGFNEAPGYIEQSPGMRDARKYMMGTMPAMGRTPEQVRRGRLSWKVQQAMIHDQPLATEDQDAFNAMPAVWQNRVLKNAGRLPEVSVFLRLPAAQAVKFFDGLTDEEQRNVGELIFRKINNNQTLTENQKDDLRSQMREKTKGMNIQEPKPTRKSSWGAW